MPLWSHFVRGGTKNTVGHPSPSATPPLGTLATGSSPTLPSDWTPSLGPTPSQGHPTPIPAVVFADMTLRRRAPNGVYAIPLFGSPSARTVEGTTPPQRLALLHPTPPDKSPPINPVAPHNPPPQRTPPSTYLPLEEEDHRIDEATYAPEEMWVRLAAILSDEPRYRALLGSRDMQAHSLLNLMQKMVDHQDTPVVLKRSIVIAMMRLCNASGAYPQCLTLQQRVHYDSDPVAAGSFGDIWKGYIGAMCVSLKVARLYRDSQIEHLLKSFAKEAILWSHLNHPNLLPFYGIYRLNNRYERVCLVSLWMENGNVSDYLKANPEVPRLSLINEVLAGLEYLHKNLVVHGDLKGANILISSGGVACLADFGLSSIVDEEALSWTSIKTATRRGGTLRWEAPELMEDSENGGVPRETFSSDVYAVASVMYEILTGQIPYHEFPRDAMVIRKVLDGIKPTRPSSDIESRLELSSGIWEVMEECWDRNPDKRPTVKQVAERLQQIPPTRLTVARMVPTLQVDAPGDDPHLLTPQTFRRFIYGHDLRFSSAEIDLLKEF